MHSLQMLETAVTSPLLNRLFLTQLRNMRCFGKWYLYFRFLRIQIQDFVKNEVEPQALEYNNNEAFNMGLFKYFLCFYFINRKMGELGLLAPTVSEEFGGGGMDATASVIIHEELSTSDPGFGLAYLGTPFPVNSTQLTPFCS